MRLLAAFAMLACVALVAGGCGNGRAGGGPDEKAAPEAAAHAEAAHADEVTLSAAAVKRGGIEVGQAAPAEIAVTLQTPGEVRLDAEHVLQVRPRFPGVVSALRKHVGDAVGRGDVLAVIQSNESLTDYEVTSSMAGTVVERDAAVGQAVERDHVLYAIADLSTVWVDLAVYPQQLALVRPGQQVRIVCQSGAPLEATGTVRYVAPVLENDTRAAVARVVLPNRDRRWRPGLFVTGHILLDRARATVAVPDEAIVRVGEGSAVFVARDTTFQLTPVVTGRSDGRMTEIVRGLEAGASIAVRGAFVLKAELEKAANE